MNYREALDEEIGTPPPSSIDLDRVIVRQRRQQRLRIWGASSAGVAGVLAATLAVTLLPGASTGTPATPGAPDVITGTGTGSADVDEGMSNGLTAALKWAVPGITWLTPDGQSTDRPTWQPVWKDTAPPYTFSASTGIAVNGQRGQLRATVLAKGPDPLTETCKSMPASVISCTEQHSPPGTSIVTTSQAVTLNDGTKATLTNVKVVRIDGLWVSLVLTSPVKPGKPPLNTDQMTAVALHPGVTFGTLPPDTKPTTGAPVDPEQLERLDKALATAVRTHAPGTKVDGSADLHKAWIHGGGDNDRDHYWAQAVISNQSKNSGLFSVDIRRTDSVFGLSCGTPSATYTCKKGSGPNGEQYRIVVNTEKDQSGEHRHITVRRKDGSWMAVDHYRGGSSPAFVLTEKQQLKIALTPTLTLG